MQSPSRSHADGFVSIPAVHQYLKQAGACGVDASDALSRAGLTPALLADSNGRITAAAFESLMSDLIDRCRDPLFGLHTSRHIAPASYSVLGYIAMNCATLGEALARVPVYEKIVGDLGVTSVHPCAGGLRISWTCCFGDDRVRRHVTENVLASWTLYSRWITGEAAQAPREVWFEHAMPPATDLDAYRSIFGAPVRFGAADSGLVVLSSQLQHPIRQADPMLLATLEAHATQLLGRIDADETLAVKVRNLLRLMVRQTLPRKEVIAERLGINPRTLQRHLEAEGTGYQKLLDEVRLELARDYLSGSALAIDAIAAALGFADARSFHRVFKGWTGLTPGQYRDHSSTHMPG